MNILSVIPHLLLAIFAFGFLVFIHELGHFLVARKANIQINEFSIGMGPALFSKEKNGILYSLRLLPLGGYVAMEGEDEELGDDVLVQAGKLPFKKATWWKRLLVMLSGAFINLLFGVVLLGIITGMLLSKPGAGIPSTQIAQFEESAVTNQWLQVGDVILSVNGKKTKSYLDLVYQLQRDKDGIFDLEIDRENEIVLLKDVAFTTIQQEGLPLQVKLDFWVQPQDPTFFKGVEFTFAQANMLIRQIWGSLFDLIRGRLHINQLAGPVGITKEITTLSAQQDWSSLFYFIAMLSLNLGVLNLVPFPALDGGKVLVLFIELFRRGKPLPPKLEIAINLFGFIVLFGLIIIVSIHDISSLFVK